jgi:single-strand DNA-binding protein
MNKVILMGRLVADPELKQTATDVSVATFTIAVNRRFAKEGQQQADFIRCTAWRQQADFICKYFPKGSMICVIGNIQTRSWDDSDGNKRYSTDVVVDEVYFTGEKRETTSQSDSTWDDFEHDKSGLTEDDFPF